MAQADQLTNVRKMTMQQQLDNAKIITVVSGKGGTGKSNLALNLSVALSKSGSRVALFDADTHFSNIYLLTGVKEKGVLADVISGRKSLNQLQTNEESGVKIISAPSGVESSDMFDEYLKEEFFRQIYKFKTNNDFIVIDTGAGFSQTIVDFSLLSDYPIIIITPEPAAVSDGYALIKILNGINGDMVFNIVVNFVESSKEAEEVYERFSLVVEHFLGAEINYLGYISEDRRVREAVQKQKPLLNLFPDSSAAICVKEIAGRIK